ncbi:MAG: phage minor capsid protein [Oscillospiraceae bacterium]
MTRSQIDELSQNLIFLINEMEDVLMKKIAAQLVSDGDVSDSSKWRIRQLARAGKLDKEALKTIKSYMSAQSEMLEDALYNAALSEIGNVDNMVKDAAARGLVDGRVKAPADRTAQSALKSYLKQAKSDLNMVNTVMRYKTKQAYVSAVNNTFWTLDKEQRVHDALGMGALEVVSGAESFQTAVRDVLKKLSEKGIPAFIDAGGHEWKPETYVQMDLRTTMGNTARAAQWQRCDDFGVDLIEVDSHLGAREKCARDQGKIYSRSGKSGTCRDGSGNVVYYYAFSSTSFGQPDGLFGINCRHNSYPYIPGISYQRYFPVDGEENAKRYKEYQTQRALERKIRESKRQCMLLSEAGDEEGLKKAALTLRNRKENYSAYSKAHDLRVHNDRTQVYGYDRSKSMKTVWAEKKAAKPLDNGGGSGIMKSRGYDFLDGVLGSDKISQDQSKSLDEIVSVIPKKHLDVIGKTVKEVEIVPNIGACSYDPVTKKLTLDPDKMNGSIIHEFGHVLADAYDTYSDPKFIEILANNLDNSWQNIYPTAHPDIPGEYIYVLDSPKFINIYQGRTYADISSADYSEPIPIDTFHEYFSVAFDAYFSNPQMLKEKDIELFNYIEGMINHE